VATRLEPGKYKIFIRAGDTQGGLGDLQVAATLEPQQLQQSLQIRKVKLAFYLMCRARRDVAIGNEFQGGVGFLQILIEVGFL
jgi:soluble P-type ATPase